MKIAINQPYFLPYIGYFQLINAVDIFVSLEQVKYIKQTWVNRNRYLLNGKDSLLSIPLKKDSSYLNICDRYIADDFNRKKLICQISNAYQKAPYCRDIIELMKEIILCEAMNLSDYIYHSIVSICRYIGIKTTIVQSKCLGIDLSLPRDERIFAICQALNSKTYINAIGGVELYSKDIFAERGIELRFIRSKPIEYKQFDNEFVPWLSILDVLMFNSKEKVRLFLQEYELL